MENLSKKDISLRLNNIKDKAKKITEKIDKNNRDFDFKYRFAEAIGVPVENLNKSTDEALLGLNNYISKADSIICKYKDEKENETEEAEEDRYKVLNNILYLDDIKLKNIDELINENNDLKTREYLKLISYKANEIIREEEIKDIDINITKLSRISVLDKLTGRAKIKRALRENYSLKRVQTTNKIYIPENKSLYEIVSITNNCGYKSREIDFFVSSIVKEFDLDNPEANALMILNNKKKIPFFFNKEILNNINVDNAMLLEEVKEKKAIKDKVSEFEMFNELLIKDVNTLELLSYEENTEEVV